MATSNAVRGASLLTNFWKAVEEEVIAAGGNDEHLGALVTKKMRPAIKQFAQLVVGTGLSFRDMIAQAKFDYLYRYANNPEQIEGQKPHPATGNVELDHPGVTLTTQHVWDRYGDGDLSELLDYAIMHPDDQRKAPIGIVWKVGNEFWCASLGGACGRCLGVRRGHPGVRWGDGCRFLRRK